MDTSEMGRDREGSVRAPAAALHPSGCFVLFFLVLSLYRRCASAAATCGSGRNSARFLAVLSLPIVDRFSSRRVQRDKIMCIAADWMSRKHEKNVFVAQCVVAVYSVSQKNSRFY